MKDGDDGDDGWADPDDLPLSLADNLVSTWWSNTTLFASISRKIQGIRNRVTIL